MLDRDIPFQIGSNQLPGFSKVIEEMGEVGQVIGKIIGLGSMGQHWDGSFLQDELEKELADLAAGIQFLTEANCLRQDQMEIRSRRKLNRFHRWHLNVLHGRDPNHGVHYEEDERVPTRI